MTEQDFFAGINKSDISVFEWLYSEYYVALMIYARNFVRDEKASEEIVQDIFLKLWESREKIEIIGSLRCYLFAAVKNHCLDYLKHKQIVHRYNEQYTKQLRNAEYFYLFTQESGESAMIANELETHIREAIGSLPEQCRKIFLMNRFENLKYHEISEKLGVTVNTVQKQISIALEKLRDKLSKYLV